MSYKAARLVGIFILSLALFNFPILGIFSKPHWLGGIPMPVLYLFVVWLVLIIVFWRLVDGKNPFTQEK
jgi:hypothetical protein